MKKLTYSEKLKDPRWQKKRLEILNRDEFKCTFCKDESSTLHVHHIAYAKDPWDVPNEDLITVCCHCHEIIEFFKSIQLTVISMCKFVRDIDFSVVLIKVYEESDVVYVSEIIDKVVNVKYSIPIKDIDDFLKS